MKMSMKPEIERKTQMLIGEIQKSSKISADEKGDLQDILLHAEAGTNGLTQEEKIQNVSESVYSLVSMMIAQRLDGSRWGKLEGLYKTIIETKWQICIVAGILAMALIFRPEVAELLKAVVK